MKKRTYREIFLKVRKGSMASKQPERVNTARKLKALARTTDTVWPQAKRMSFKMEFCEPCTAIGNKKKEAALTTMVSTAASEKIAARLARNNRFKEMGRGARLV